MTHEMVIRGGTVVDGSGRPGILADVAVQTGRIASIGTKPGRFVLAAEGD